MPIAGRMFQEVVVRENLHDGAQQELASVKRRFQLPQKGLKVKDLCSTYRRCL
jgi:hypothetical protein